MKIEVVAVPEIQSCIGKQKKMYRKYGNEHNYTGDPGFLSMKSFSVWKIRFLRKAVWKAAIPERDRQKWKESGQEVWEGKNRIVSEEKEESLKYKEQAQ